MSTRRAAPFVLLVCAVLGGFACPAQASVRFGSNVFIGGHDFSHRSFDRRHRAIVHLYDRTPRNAGCVSRSDRRGGHVLTCRLRRIRPR